MSRIRGSDTRIELLVRKALHSRGFRYRLGGSGLPGRPDVVLPRHRTVIFVHGCFWHGHDCALFRLPKTRPEFWRGKIDANRARDGRVEDSLVGEGWRVGIVWECALRGKSKAEVERVVRELADWIRIPPVNLDTGERKEWRD